jgi:nucleoside-diphosphate-sugar epimerase
MILYNGTTGSLGRYFADAVAAAGISGVPIRSRLEDFSGFRHELDSIGGSTATFLHFAAKVSVSWCEEHPEETMRTNVDDTLDATRIFVEHCRNVEITPRVVYISSAHLYAKNDGEIRETDAVLPRSVYAASKFEAEAALKEFALSVGVELRIPRIFGLVAPIQPDYYVLHSMLKRAREKRLAGIPGLSNVRDYLDSRDVCRALVRIAELSDTEYASVCPDRILNVASGSGVTIRGLAETCVRALYPESEANALLREISEAPPRADDVPRIVASIDRYRTLFQESPAKITLAETVRDAIKTPTPSA